MSRTRLVATLLCVGVASALAGPPMVSAAKKLVTSKQIKNGTIKTKDISTKARAKLRGQTGPQGPVGPTGPAGAPGDSATADGPDRQFVLFNPPVDATCVAGFPSGTHESVNCVTVMPAYTGPGLEIRDFHVATSTDATADIFVLMLSQDFDSNEGQIAGCEVPEGEHVCSGGGASFEPQSIFWIQVVSDEPLPNLSLSYDTYRPKSAPPLVGGPFDPGPLVAKRITRPAFGG